MIARQYHSILQTLVIIRPHVTVKTKACGWVAGPEAFRVTETHTGAWLWKHTQTQTLVTLVGSPPYIRKYQEIPESSRQTQTRNRRKQTRFLVTSDLQQSLNPTGKAQQTHFTIHLRLSLVQTETRPSDSHPEIHFAKNESDSSEPTHTVAFHEIKRYTWRMEIGDSRGTNLGREQLEGMTLVGDL